MGFGGFGEESDSVKLCQCCLSNRLFVRSLSSSMLGLRDRIVEDKTIFGKEAALQHADVVLRCRSSDHLTYQWSSQ